jgi:hypothetical protein
MPDRHFELLSAFELRPSDFLPMLRLLVITAILLLSGCATPWTPRFTLPSENMTVRGQLTIHSDFPVPADAQLLDELIAQRSAIERQLMVHVSDEPIHIFLFANESAFKSFMRLHHPDFPTRRAFFLETKTRMEVYAQAGPRMAEDLRHEVTHGYLHSTVPNLPLWLDEGLAKYYEVPPSRKGMNRQLTEVLAKRMRDKTWTPNLKQLEKIQPDEEMSLDDYAEAWALVHWMLEGGPENREILCLYLADLRRDGKSSSLTTRLAEKSPQANAAFLEHLRRVGVGSK